MLEITRTPFGDITKAKDNTFWCQAIYRIKLDKFALPCFYGSLAAVEIDPSRKSPFAGDVYLVSISPKWPFSEVQNAD